MTMFIRGLNEYVFSLGQKEKELNELMSVHQREKEELK